MNTNANRIQARRVEGDPGLRRGVLCTSNYIEFLSPLLLVYMAKLEYVSSAGLRAFKRAYLELHRKGCTLSAKNVGKSVMEVFELTGFIRLFKFI